MLLVFPGRGTDRDEIGCGDCQRSRQGHSCSVPKSSTSHERIDDAPRRWRGGGNSSYSCLPSPALHLRPVGA